MKLASIQAVTSVDRHPNADSLEVCSVLGFKCITRLGQFKSGDVVCFVSPDTVLPDKAWAQFYKSKSSRVKSIRLRGQWSEGVIERLDIVGYAGEVEIGRDISDDIGVAKYEPPTPQDLSAIGRLPFGIPETDEERIESLEYQPPWGSVVDVTLKIDGQSWSGYANVLFDDQNIKHCKAGVCGRRLEYKLDSDNNFTKNQHKYDVLRKLVSYVTICNSGVCIRGEQYGNGIQGSHKNPHSKMPLSLAFYSVWLIDERRYARKGDELYAYDFIPKLGLPVCPVLERDVFLTPELVKKYAEDLTAVNGQPFEGVVIQHAGGSFKVLNKLYDSTK